jgi:hypothetical protein
LDYNEKGKARDEKPAPFLFSGMLYISLSVYATGGVFRKKNTAVPISIIPNTP